MYAPLLAETEDCLSLALVFPAAHELAQLEVHVGADSKVVRPVPPKPAPPKPAQPKPAQPKPAPPKPVPAAAKTGPAAKAQTMQKVKPENADPEAEAMAQEGAPMQPLVSEAQRLEDARGVHVPLAEIMLAELAVTEISASFGVETLLQVQRLIAEARQLAQLEQR